MIAFRPPMGVLAAAACLIFLAVCAISAGPVQQKQSRHSTPTSRPPAKTASAPSAPPAKTAQFVDVTRAGGIDFHLTCGSLDKRYIMETMCGGIAVFDYDNDGWMDIFLVNGSTLDDLRAGKCHPRKLYRNNHDGTFAHVTSTGGLNHCGRGFGPAGGDSDEERWEALCAPYLGGDARVH